MFQALIHFVELHGIPLAGVAAVWIGLAAAAVMLAGLAIYTWHYALNAAHKERSALVARHVEGEEKRLARIQDAVQR